MNEYALSVIRRHADSLYSGRLVSGSRRCGVGWLLHVAGVSDAEMKVFDQLNLNERGYHLRLFLRYRTEFARFGISSAVHLMKWTIALDQQGLKALRPANS